MEKTVIYNGGTDAMYYSSSPSLLVKGKEYKVIGEKVGAWQTNYTLEGVEGEFNSVWFNEKIENIKTNNEKSKPSYLAKMNIYSNDISAYVGVRIKIDSLDGNEIKTKMTTPVESIVHIYDNIYRIETMNSVYITEVNKRTVV